MKKLLAYLQLLRLPNVFTAMSDIFMGFLIAHGSLGAWRQFIPLLVASSSIYLAGMADIPPEFYDAARVDGATESQVLYYITVPLLGSTIRLTIFLSVLGSFQQFVLAWVLTIPACIALAWITCSLLHLIFG